MKGISWGKSEMYTISSLQLFYAFAKTSLRPGVGVLRCSKEIIKTLMDTSSNSAKQTLWVFFFLNKNCLAKQGSVLCSV